MENAPHSQEIFVSG